MTCECNEPILPSEKSNDWLVWRISSFSKFGSGPKNPKFLVMFHVASHLQTIFSQGAQQLRFFLHATALLVISAVTVVAMATEGKDDATVERTVGSKNTTKLPKSCGRVTVDVQ